MLIDQLPAVLDIDQFKQAADDGDEIGDVILRKQFVVEARDYKTDDAADDRTIEFTASTGAVDRDNDTIDPKGWDLTNFQKNGPFLWAHDYRKPPIGWSISTWIGKGKLKTIVDFLPVDLADHEHVKFADMIYQMYRKNFMQAVSVGFRPQKWVFNEERSGGIDFSEQNRRMEISGTPVPSNPEALQSAKSAGIDVSPFLKWARTDESKLWVPEDIRAAIMDLGEVVTVDGGLRKELAEAKARIAELEAKADVGDDDPGDEADVDAEAGDDEAGADDAGDEADVADDTVEAAGDDDADDGMIDIQEEDLAAIGDAVREEVENQFRQHAGRLED